MSNKLHALQKVLGYQFEDEALLLQALTHRSKGAKNNERLEFLGDAVLNFAIADLLFHKFLEAKEGQLTRLRAQLVKEETLSSLGLKLNLSEYLILGSCEKKSGGFRNEAILADCVEAILGAIYLEKGFIACREVISVWFSDRLSDLHLTDAQKDAKTALQEYLQARKRELPIYRIVETTGKPHDQEFTVACECEALSVEAKGKSRRIAEQRAAKLMLKRLQEE